MIGVRQLVICSLTALHAAESRQARSSARPRSLMAPMARQRLGPRWSASASRHSASVAHPHGLPRGQAAEERAGALVELGLAELGDPGPGDLAAELEGHQLGAVTDPERRHPEREEPVIDPRSALGVHRRRPTGEDQRDRVPAPDLLRAERVRHQLGVDAGIADAPGDQLRVLPAQVEHEHRPLLGDRHGQRQRVDRPHALLAEAHARR